jgi:hypothetical protein
MGDAGSPYARFKRALKTRNLHLVRATAAELSAPLPLDDALEVLALIRAADPARYDRGAARWAGRAALEYPDVEIAELSLLVAALSAPDEGLVERVRDVLHRPDHGEDAQPRSPR